MLEDRLWTTSFPLVLSQCRSSGTTAVNAAERNLGVDGTADTITRLKIGRLTPTRLFAEYIVERYNMQNGNRPMSEQDPDDRPDAGLSLITTFVVILISVLLLAYSTGTHFPYQSATAQAFANQGIAAVPPM